MNKSDITRDYYMLKGSLAQSEPVIVWNDGGRKAGKRSSLGFFGGRERAAPLFSPWSQVSIPMDVPLNLKGGDCTCTEAHMTGHVRVTPEEATAHPEWMSDDGELEWDLDIQKLVAYHVGYGASKFFRTLNVFEMFWYAEGMKTAFSG